jgi:hypothetical protein
MGRSKQSERGHPAINPVAKPGRLALLVTTPLFML